MARTREKYNVMRRLLAAAALAAALPVGAQQAPPPPDLEPLPEAPQPVGVDPAQQAADMGITIRPGEKVERLTLDGQQYLVVTTQWGTEYHLIEAVPGFGPQAGWQQGDSGLRVPMWRVLEW
ncbi:MAG: DUF2782 domain-containing protein [Burkholderiales bacterium]